MGSKNLIDPENHAKLLHAFWGPPISRFKQSGSITKSRLVCERYEPAISKSPNYRYCNHIVELDIFFLISNFQKLISFRSSEQTLGPTNSSVPQIWGESGIWAPKNLLILKTMPKLLHAFWGPPISRFKQRGSITKSRLVCERYDPAISKSKCNLVEHGLVLYSLQIYKIRKKKKVFSVCPCMATFWRGSPKPSPFIQHRKIRR